MDWVHLWNRKHTLQHDYLGRFLWFTKNSYYRLKNILTVSQPNGKSDFYASKREWSKLMAALAREVYQANFLKKIPGRFQVFRSDFIAVAKRLSQGAKLRQLSNRELLRRYQALVGAHLRYTVFFWHPWAINEQVAPWFQGQLKKSFPGQADWIYQTVTLPTRHITMERQLLELVKFKMRGELARRINGHVQKYQWLSVYSLLDSPYTKRDFLRMAASEKKPNKLMVDDRQKMAKRRQGLRQALQILRVKPQLYQIARVLNVYAWLRTERVDVWRQALYLVQPFYHELERRMGLKRNQATHLTYDEIVAFLRTGQKPDGRKVKPGALVYLRNGQLRIVREKSEIMKILARELKSHDYSRVLQIRGAIASLGIARGKVKIVMLPEDCRSFRKGDILVSNMTHPDYIAGMRKAGAIVTDEGGISSHAAIVAREMKKPCIIGTKIATKVLKDGDLVEVDANKGIVKILKRK